MRCNKKLWVNYCAYKIVRFQIPNSSEIESELNIDFNVFLSIRTFYRKNSTVVNFVSLKRKYKIEINYIVFLRINLTGNQQWAFVGSLNKKEIFHIAENNKKRCLLCFLITSLHLSSRFSQNKIK